jgi:hypothetical protein
MSTATTIEMLFEKAEDYGKTSIELFKLNAIDKSADLVSSLVTKVAIAIVVAMFILILNIGLAFWVGELLGKVYYGFFAVAGFYALLSLLICVFQHSLVKIPISNRLIVKLLKQKNI